MDYPYSAYKNHIVLGLLYKQTKDLNDEKAIYSINDLSKIKSVIDNFIFFVQPKWKIALDIPGSGNTRNIGGVTNIEKLINGTGPFSTLGEDIFDDYWMNYFNKADARLYGPGKPNYHNIETYKDYKTNQALLDKLK